MVFSADCFAAVTSRKIAMTSRPALTSLDGAAAKIRRRRKLCNLESRREIPAAIRFLKEPAAWIPARGCRLRYEICMRDSAARQNAENGGACPHSFAVFAMLRKALRVESCGRLCAARSRERDRRRGRAAKARAKLRCKISLKFAAHTKCAGFRSIPSRISFSEKNLLTQ